MEARRANRPRPISTVLALGSLPGEAPLSGWVDMSITVSLSLRCVIAVGTPIAAPPPAQIPACAKRWLRFFGQGCKWKSAGAI